MKAFKIVFLVVALSLSLSSLALAKNIAGVWNGILTTEGLYQNYNYIDVTLNLKQTDNKFSGGVSAPSIGLTGTMNGTVNKDRFSFKVVGKVSGCNGSYTFRGKGFISGNGKAMVFLFSGPDYCGLKHSRGRGYVEKR